MSQKRDRGTRFRLGNVYSIDYDDHWSSERTYRDSVDDEPCRLRSIGRLIKETPRFVILEHQECLSDSHATNKRSDHHGIMKSCITRAQDFGKHD